MMSLPANPIWPDDDALREAAESEMFGTENPGFCLACGAEADGCEPDARNYRCDECGKRYVFGAAEIVLMRYPL